MKDIATATAFILAFVIVGMICALCAHWLTEVFWRMGATEGPAQYLAYMIVGCIAVFITASALDWWRAP